MQRIFPIAILTLALLASQRAEAQAGKDDNSKRGGKAASHMSDKAVENSNAQWSADPERGWLRSEERHELHDRRHQGPVSKGKDRERHKGEGKQTKGNTGD